MSSLQSALAAVEQAFVDGDADAAFAAADRVIRLGARTPYAFVARAEALQQLGQNTAALDDLLDAATLRPEEREFKLRALRFALTQGFHEQAAQLASVWAQIDPQSIFLSEFTQAIQHLKPPFGYCELHDGVLTGWAIGSESKTVKIEVDGAYGSVECGRPTLDLKTLGLGDGRNGFSVKLPSWQRVVRVGIEGKSLWGSPFARPLAPATPPSPDLPARPKGVDVVIPVYRGAAETLACIDSVLSSIDRQKNRLVIVNDYSPDQALVDALQRLERSGRLILINREINGGFIGAVQTAIFTVLPPDRDLVLVNADTLVHGDWLERLQKAAYSNPTIATVTPLSNNAELLSHPEPHRPGLMPTQDQLAALDEAARKNRVKPVVIPTGIGFCMYIRRDALAALGGFDEAFLVRGYAEENDFCIRAAEKGWTNVAAPNVFVAHRGEVSFGPEKRWLAAHNVRRLKARHPNHDEEYERFLSSDPLLATRRSLQRRAAAGLFKGKPLKLVVTEIDDLAWRLLTSPDVRLLVTNQSVALEFRGIPGLGRIEYIDKDGLTECEEDLQSLEFSNVILCSKHPIAERFARYVNRENLPADFSVEDSGELSPMPEANKPMRLLVPAPVTVEDFRALFNLAKQWQSQSTPHQLFVVGSTFNDEQLEGLSNIHVVELMGQSRLGRQDIADLQKSVIDRYRITGFALLKATFARDWAEVASRTELPIYRLPERDNLPASKHKVVKDKSPTKTEANPFAGALLGLDGLCLTGWVKNKELPSEAVVVELLADGLPIMLVRADKTIHLPQSTNKISVLECGFQCFLRLELVNNIRRIRARIANTMHYLDGEIDLVSRSLNLASKQPRSLLKGTNHSSRPLSYASNRGGLRVVGVAIDTLQPNRIVSVFAEYKGKRILTARADAWTHELNDVPGINAAHGFSFTLPIEFADGQEHLIHILDEDGRALFGSPVTVCCTDQSVDSWVHSINMMTADAQVLTQVLQMAQRHIPLSVDFSAYSDWKLRFGSTAVESVQEKVFVVLGWSSSDGEGLRITLNSLLDQTHTDWIFLVKGLGTHRDNRIRFVGEELWKSTLVELLQETEYVSVIEPGDVWHPNTLAHALTALKKQNADIAYSDCDFADTARTPWFKPDWCLDTFLAQPLLHHGFVARSAVLVDAIETEVPSDWPWLAATTVGDFPARYAHVRHPHHTQANPIPLPRERVLGKIQERFKVGLTVDQEVQRHPLIHPLRITYPNPAWPSVTLIVPTRDGIKFLKPCIESLLTTDYPEIDICIVDNGSKCKRTLTYLKSLSSKNVRVLSWPYAFNYSSINNFAVRHSDSEIIGLINNDVEVLDGGWLKAMVTQLMRDGVGAVGAKLLWKNYMVQHGGVLLGLHGLAGHIGNNWLDKDAGYCGINQIVRSAGAVTAACLVIRRADYDQLGGLNENAFPVAFNDVDLCLRLRAIGKRIVWTPYSRLIHAESASRGLDQLPEKRARLEREKENLFNLWGEALIRDPYYNPNLNLDQYSHTALALPPRNQ